MIFFYIRHGDPIYDPDSLTPLGHRQAEAVAKRLAMYGIDEIYSSTSNRAKLTAQPTCEILKKQMTELDFCNESHAWEQLTVDTENGKRWLFHHSESLSLMTEPEVVNLGFNWYEHPAFEKYNFKKGIHRIMCESDKFFASLGYEHIPYTGKYRVTQHSDKRVALFAHQGFGIAFLSCVLDIPYPLFASHFDMTHTGMTVIEFADNNGYSTPKVLTLSSDSHIYKEGLPTNYNNTLRF